eukprot:7646418-Prorocentrum_lima.AAC.1
MAARQGLPQTATVGSQGTPCSACGGAGCPSLALCLSPRSLAKMSCGPPGSRLSHEGRSGCSPGTGSP